MSRRATALLASITLLILANRAENAERVSANRVRKAAPVMAEPPRQQPSYFQNARVERYVSKKGESLGRIVSRFYGNADCQNFVLALNPQLQMPLKPDQEILLPSVVDYTVRRGDTLTAIAQRYLGKKERFSFMMANGELPGYPDVEAGTHLKIPFSVTVTPAPGQTLENLAKKFYSQAYAVEIILAYNGLPRGTSHVATLDEVLKNTSGHDQLTLDLPLMAFVIQAGDRSPTLESRRGPAILEKAIQSYDAGQFEEALSLLSRAQKTPWNAFFESSLISRYQAFCLIAFGDLSGAKSHFLRMRALDPIVELSSEHISPKIQRIFSDLN